MTLVDGLKVSFPQELINLNSVFGAILVAYCKNEIPLLYVAESRGFASTLYNVVLHLLRGEKKWAEITVRCVVAWVESPRAFVANLKASRRSIETETYRIHILAHNVMPSQLSIVYTRVHSVVISLSLHQSFYPGVRPLSNRALWPWTPIVWSLSRWSQRRLVRVPS